MKFISAIVVCVLVASTPLMATNYYFSSSEGKDANVGTSISLPFPSLEKLRTIALRAGDSILLKRGDVFTGHLEIDNQGEPNRPIVIAAYGEGKAPTIDGNGHAYAIKLLNPSYLTITGLEIVNWEGTYGIRFEAEDAGEMRELHFRDLDIHDVGKASMDLTDPSKTDGAISGRVWKGSSASWWDGLTFRNLNIHNVGSCGITFGNEVKLHELPPNDPYYRPHKNVVIEDCRVDSTARDGIWIRQCDRALIQRNTVAHTGLNAIANGIWFWDCTNSIMQYNEGYECLSVRGNDGAPFSIDNHCVDCTIQYNYSHDNEGPGYMIFGRMGDGRGNTVKGNLSYNDNVTRTYKSGTAAIALVSQVKDALVEDNIIVAGRETHYILGHRDWEGIPISVTYRNNLFLGNGFATFSNPEEVMFAGHFDNNFFVNVPELPGELQTETEPQNFFAIMHERLEQIRSGGE